MYFLYNSIFFLLLNYSATVSFCCNYSFLYNFLLIYSKASIGALEKRLFEFLESPVNYCFEEIADPSQSPFQYTGRPSWLFSKKLFRKAILQVTCQHLLSSKEIPHHTLYQEFSKILKRCKAKGLLSRPEIYKKKLHYRTLSEKNI